MKAPFAKYQGRKLIGPFDYATQPPVREGVYLFVPLPEDTQHTNGPRMVRWTKRHGKPGLPGLPAFLRFRRPEDAAAVAASLPPDLGFERHERYCARGMQWYGLEAPK